MSKLSETTKISRLSESAKFYVIIGISFFIMIGVGMLPPFGEMTVYGMQMFGVFLGCIFGWLLGIVIPVALLGIVMAGLLVSGQTVDSMMMAVQSAQMVLVIFWALIFVYGLGKCGILDFLSTKIMSIKWCVKSPWHLAVAIWLCTMVCAALSSQPFATMILMFSMFYSMAEKIGAKKRSAYTVFVLVFIAAVAAVGVGMVPYSSMILMSLSIMSAAVPGIVYNIPLICVINFVVTFSFIVCGALLLKVLMKTQVIKTEFSMDSAGDWLQRKAVFDTKVKWGFFYIIFLVAIMVFPTFLPAESAIKVFMGRIGMVGMFAVVVTLMCLTTVDGKRLIDFEQAMRGGAVNWQVYFMMGTALVVSGQLVTDQAGLALTIKGAVDGIVGDMSAYVLALVFIVVGLALTNCITNIVAMQLIIPILTTLMIMKGVNPALLVGIAGIVLDHGLILPSGSPLGAFIHGNSEWMSSKQVYIYASCAALCLAVACAVIGIPLALWVAQSHSLFY